MRRETTRVAIVLLRAHSLVMPRKPRRTDGQPDLFSGPETAPEAAAGAITPRDPDRAFRVRPRTRALPDIVPTLSDGALAALLAVVVAELEQRLAPTRPNDGSAVSRLQDGARQAATRLSRLSRPRSQPAAADPALSEAKRKAVRLALAAGVKPGQVAKHFGVPLAAIRKLRTDAT